MAHAKQKSLLELMFKGNNMNNELNQSIEERIIFELDSFAMNYDKYEYGLPTHEPELSKMKEIISIILKQSLSK